MQSKTQNYSLIPAVFGLVSGLLFGAGLWLGGMTDPYNVLGFLDFSGEWRPELALVLGAAVLTSAISYRIAYRNARPAFATAFEIPTSTTIDRPLILGSIIFGIGWGIAGYCPGPAIVSIGHGSQDALLFTLAMLLGMFAYSRFDRIAQRNKS